MADSSQPLTPPNGDLNLNPSQNPSPPPSPSPLPLPPPPSSPIAARKSERKRKIREFPDMSHSRKIPTIWSDSDELSLLKSAREFKNRTGAEPKGLTMREFFEEVKGRIGEHLDLEKVTYKMRRLKVKWLSSRGEVPSGGHERAVYELSDEVWRTDEGDEKARNEGDKDRTETQEKTEDFYATEPIQIIYADFPTKHPNLTEALQDHYKSNKSNFSEVSLEKGLKEMDVSRSKEMEKKWKKQLEADMRLRMRKHEIVKEVYGLLVDCVKGQVA
ncbi:hypothetical protein LUZ60_001346 [Juncus effusus]|nr:hypothetical protein LUZ60_001346 [Juncus effusus]